MKKISPSKLKTFGELSLVFKNLKAINIVAEYLNDMRDDESLFNAVVDPEDEESLMLFYAVVAFNNMYEYESEPGYNYNFEDAFALLAQFQPRTQEEFYKVFNMMLDHDNYKVDKDGFVVKKSE